MLGGTALSLPDLRSTLRHSACSAYTRPPLPLTGGRRPYPDRKFNMSPADRSEAPIYARLVEEHGDVLAETRRVAEQTLREADRAIDFSGVRPPVAFR